MTERNAHTRTFGSRAGGVVLGSSLLLASLVLPGRSLAQSTSGTGTGSSMTGTPIKADFKGTIGLGLIGMELGMVIPAVAGARGAWPYIVFPVIGAGGGAAAGYFLLEKGSGHPELAVASLVTGMALLIPSLVLTLAETAYEPEDEQASTGPLPRWQGARLSKPLAAAAAAGPGLLRVSEKGVFVAPPALTVASMVTPQEALRTGAPRERVLHAPLLSGVF
ncbi:MAG: hypothetical protein ACHQ53_05280 [Polyangiales bacterium]